MTLAVLSISRRHVLGTLHSRCDAITGSIPVYLAGDKPELLGYADEGLGHYADAFSFHLNADLCKRLAAGQFSYDMGFDHSEPNVDGSRGRVKLTSITLVRPKGYDKPVKKTKLADKDSEPAPADSSPQ